jgi:ribonuclease BN (tRNA processing enzyme)
LQLTILGTSGAYPRAGGACSGYLIEDGNIRLLIDCGTGVLSNLQQHIPPRDVTHIIISHLHADHFLDLFPFRYVLWRLGQGRPLLYLPPGGAEALLRISSIFDPAPTFFSDFFQVAEYDPEVTLQVEDLVIQFAQVKHYIPSYAMAIKGSRKIVYSADSGPCNELEELAKDADIFLCESARCESDDDSSWGHLSPQEAAEMARRARVRKLVLTHFWPECDYSRGLKMARDAFGGGVEVAEEHHTYIV